MPERHRRNGIARARSIAQLAQHGVSTFSHPELGRTATAAMNTYNTQRGHNADTELVGGVVALWHARSLTAALAH